jgi:hypothetical protein
VEFQDIPKTPKPQSYLFALTIANLRSKEAEMLLLNITMFTAQEVSGGEHRDAFIFPEGTQKVNNLSFR